MDLSSIRYINRYRFSDIGSPIVAFGRYKMQCEAGCCESRMFLTKEEKVQKLQGYKDWLESESKGVTEAIAELKKAK
jgi:hypothetical protein